MTVFVAVFAISPISYLFITPSNSAISYQADPYGGKDLKAAKLNTPTDAENAAPRIALVDYNKVLKSYSKAIRSQKEMEELASQYQRERNQRESELQASSGEALLVKKSQMASFAQTASKVLEDKRQRLTQELTTDINQAIASASKNSCDLVFVAPGVPSPGALIYAANSPDISNQILERLDNSASSRASPINIPARNLRIALVDYNKVLKSYSKAIRSQKEMEELATDINQAIASASKNSCDLVFVAPGTPSPGALIYAANSPDISGQILERLDNSATSAASPINIPARNLRIALVDYNKVLKRYSKAIRSQKEMEELASQYQRERNQREAELQASSGEALLVKKSQMASFAQSASKVLEDKRQRLTQELTTDINQAIASVERDSCMGYDLVFIAPQTPSPGAVIFLEGYPDITEQVLNKLNNL